MLKPQTQPRLSLTEAYHATQRWLDHAGLRTVSIKEPADGVVELWSTTHIGRVRINTGPVSQGAVLALLRASEEAGLIPLLFSATGFSNGAVGFGVSQNIALFDLAADGDILPINTPANALMPDEALEPAFATPIEAVEAVAPISYFEVPEMEDELEEVVAETVPSAGWRNCPKCGSQHHPSTTVCASCGMDLSVRAGGQLLGPTGQPAVVEGSRSAPGATVLRCRNCGSHDIELIKPH
ncbi:MAG: hypothetical protein GY720_19225 [bacterium]|nr:hypothetical protein [bacterium]